MTSAVTAAPGPMFRTAAAEHHRPHRGPNNVVPTTEFARVPQSRRGERLEDRYAGASARSLVDRLHDPMP